MSDIKSIQIPKELHAKIASLRKPLSDRQDNPSSKVTMAGVVYAAVRLLEVELDDGKA